MFTLPAKHLPVSILKRYETVECKHASAILAKDFPKELDEIVSILDSFQFTTNQVCQPGGGMSVIAKSIHTAFDAKDWAAKGFAVSFVVDGVERSSETHEVDHYKTQVAVETEWNSKDSVFDRDLKSFRLLHDLGIISVGVVITRSTSLQGVFDKIPFGVGEKYGPSTTHTAKLIEEIKAGTGGNCPILVFGITEKCYIEEPITSTNLAFIEAEYNDKLARKSRRALRNNPR